MFYSVIGFLPSSLLFFLVHRQSAYLEPRGCGAFQRLQVLTDSALLYTSQVCVQCDPVLLGLLWPWGQRWLGVIACLSGCAVMLYDLGKLYWLSPPGPLVFLRILWDGLLTSSSNCPLWQDSQLLIQVPSGQWWWFRRDYPSVSPSPMRLFSSCTEVLTHQSGVGVAHGNSLFLNLQCLRTKEVSMIHIMSLPLSLFPSFTILNFAVTGRGEFPL